MYTEVFSKLGLSKNESKIYETLLVEGESPVGHIATKSKINRRNVYDSMNRLIEKGLVFEILQKNENRYKAVDPRKLMELLKEKETALASILPDLDELYNGKPHEEDVYIYRGIEGWKNFMRDILRTGEDVYIIGGKGAWADNKIEAFREQFLKDAATKKINVRVLYDIEIQKNKHKILSILDAEHRFLPEGFSTTAAVTIFGNQIVIQSGINVGKIDENTTSTVIINKSIATTFKIWFKLMWDCSQSSN
jgi:sugar-specific transcriptional regulator TrmB